MRLEIEGDKVTGLTKLPVRQGQAPMAAVGYAVLDWARREQLSSVAPDESGGGGRAGTHSAHVGGGPGTLSD